MAQDIVSGLFGLSPYEIGRQREAETDAAALQYARLDPLQRASMGMFQAGAGLGRIGGGMLGMQDPMVVEAQQRREGLAGSDLHSPEGLRAAAVKFQQTDPRTAFMLAERANEMEAKRQQAMLSLRKDTREQEELDFKRKEAFELKKQSDMEKLRLREMEIVNKAEQAEREGRSTEMYRQQMLELRRLGLEIASAKQAASAAQGPKLSNFDAKSLERSDKAAEAANPALQLLEQAERLYGNYSSSRTEPIIGGAARVAASMGVGGEGAKKRAADYETAQQIAKDLGVIKLGLIGGSDTERELQIAIDTAPSPDKTVEANMAIIANQKKAISILQSEPDFKREWIDRNGSLAKKDSVTGESYGAAWRKFQKANFKASTAPTNESSGSITPPTTLGPYSDPEKEARYRAWVKQQSGGK